MNTNRNKSTKEIELPDRFASASKLALSAFGRLRNMSIADRKLVYASLVTRFQGGQPSRRLAAASALQQYIDEVGEVPAAHRYGSWRDGHIDCVDLPSVTFIRNTYGSWANAIAQFRDEAVLDVKRERLTGSQPVFSDNELIAVVIRWLLDHVVEWDSEVPRLACRSALASGCSPVSRVTGHAKLGSRNYRDWLMAERQSGESLPLPELIADRVGGWPKAVRRAIQQIQDDELRAVLHDASLTTDERRREMVLVIQTAAEDSTRSLQTGAFDRWVERRADVEGAYEKTLLKLRSSDRVLRSFRSWSEALRHAGLKPDVRHQYGAAVPTRNYSIDELIEIAVEARRSVGELSFATFSRWRKGAVLINPDRPIPTARWMRSAIGDWARINALAEKSEAAK